MNFQPPEYDDPRDEDDLRDAGDKSCNMREIKFRGYYTGDSEFSPMWVYGSLIREGDRCSIMQFDGQMCWSVEPESVGQFVGVYAVDGREIYEGHKVTAHYFYFSGNHDQDGEIVGTVMYSDWGAFGIANHREEKDPQWLDLDDTSHFEVPCIEIIGNSFELGGQPKETHEQGE